MDERIGQSLQRAEEEALQSYLGIRSHGRCQQRSHRYGIPEMQPSNLRPTGKIAA